MVQQADNDDILEMRDKGGRHNAAYASVSHQMLESSAKGDRDQSRDGFDAGGGIG